MTINHAHLRAFHAVASSGSFTRAAETAHVSQPTLSGQVKSLEERFSVQLFERRSRGIELTGLGRALFEQTDRLFLLETEIEQLLSTAHGLISGDLRSSVTSHLRHQRSYLELLLRRFSRSWDEILP